MASREVIDVDGDLEVHDAESIMGASSRGQTEEVRQLIAAGVNVTARDRWQSTALHRSAVGGHVETASLLLEAGAGADAVNVDKRTPLHLAAANGHPAVASTLIDGGANVDARDGWDPKP